MGIFAPGVAILALSFLSAASSARGTPRAAESGCNIPLPAAIAIVREIHRQDNTADQPLTTACVLQVSESPG